MVSVTCHIVPINSRDEGVENNSYTDNFFSSVDLSGDTTHQGKK